MRKILITTTVFCAVFVFHAAFFGCRSFPCAITAARPWVWLYFEGGEYYLGLSYALSFAFAVFSFLRFKDSKGRALGAGTGAVAWGGALWALTCFLTGCCGSPMLIVYLGFIGVSTLKIPKAGIFVTTAAMTLFGALWLMRRGSRGSCRSHGSCEKSTDGHE